jgi:hypothetical protein
VQNVSQHATQGNYQAWLARLEEKGINPDIVIIDDKWQRYYDTLEIDRAKWPDLKGFIEAQHGRGRKVLLWLALWYSEGQLRDEQGIIPFDATDHRFENRLRNQVGYLLSSDGIDADGFKVDWIDNVPDIRAEFSGGIGGIELLHHYLEIIYQAAKVAKKDSLIVTHCANPYFIDVTDMLRLNDLRGDEGDIISVMRHRAAVARAAGFSLLDRDNFAISFPKQWADYTLLSQDKLIEAKDVHLVRSLYYLSELPRISGLNEDSDRSIESYL